MLLFTVCAFVVLNNAVESARILSVLPIPSHSHYAGANQLMLTLAERGHEVVVVSPFPAKVKHSNYRNVTVVIDSFLSDKSISLYDMLRLPIRNYLPLCFQFGLHVTETILKNDNFRALLDSGEKFDAVIIGQFFTDAFQALCRKYNIPCIIYTPLLTLSLIDFKIANPTPLSYISDFFVPYTDQMTFFQRVYNCLVYWLTRFAAQTYLYPKQEELIRKYLDLDVRMDDLFKETSLVLRNSHVAFTGALPTVPNLVEIGGFHLTTPKNLTGELRKYLDAATKGVVYFSMGSILRSSNMSKDKLQLLLKALGRVDRDVLWKYEEDNLVGLPKNVKIVKWAPQIDVLAHPNVKLFITHGGVFSTIESINFKVPMVGLPIFGDQVSNMRFCESRGFARSVQYEELNDDNLLEAINEVLTQPKYAENVKLQSQILQDTPISQMEKAMFYIEYVIRYNGAPQLRVPAMEFSSYKQHSFDVIFFILAVMIVMFYATYKTIRSLCKRQIHAKKD